MKKFLLLSLAAATAVSAAAGPLTLERCSKEAFGKVLATPGEAKQKVTKAKKVSKDAQFQVVEANGVKMKKLVKDGLEVSKAKARVARASENAALSESFENYDGTDGYLPEGWSIESKDATSPNPWFISSGALFGSPDGDYAAFINYSTDYCDEYLVTKEVTIGQDQQLTFYAMVSAWSLFSMDNLDWDTYEYVGDRVVAQDFKVLISEDGGLTWNVLQSYADYYKDYSFMDMLYLDTWDKYTISLADYAGKKVKIAFEYVGADGNLNGLDNVNIDVPSIEVSYSYPAYTKYFGISRDISALPYNIAIEPVFSPITWTNTTDEPSATFSWSYMNADSEMATSTDRDLTVSYVTDFSSAFTSRNNLYYAPTLIGSAPGAADGEFSRCDYVQAGGKGQFQLSDSEGNPYICQLGMSAFDYNTEGLTFAYDASGIPFFGYSTESDEYWTNYSFPDEDDRVDGNYAYVDGLMNIYLASEAPLVIDGAWLLGYGHGLNADNEFTLEVIPLTDEGALDTPLATAKIKGSDVQIAYEGASDNYYALDFAFDKPVVISSDVCDQYVVRLTGLHGCGEYFAPFQSDEDNPDGLYVSAIQKVVSWMGSEYTSLTMTYRLTGERNAFAIMLDAAYPWLQGEDEVSLEDNAGSLALNSYYDGSEFSVEAPEWLQVSVSGVNDECVASFVASDEASSDEANVTLSVPGFSKVVKVKGIKAGVSSILNDANQAAAEYYNLQGIRVDASTPGLYIRRQGTSVEKVVVK